MKSFDEFIEYANERGGNLSADSKKLLKDAFDYIAQQGIDPFNQNSFDLKKIKDLVDLQNPKNRFIKESLRRPLFAFGLMTPIYVEYMAVRDDKKPENEIVIHDSPALETNYPKSEDGDEGDVHDRTIDSRGISASQIIGDEAFDSLLNFYSKEKERVFAALGLEEEEKSHAETAEADAIIYDLIHSNYAVIGADRLVSRHALPLYYLDGPAIRMAEGDSLYLSQLYSTFSCFSPSLFKNPIFSSIFSNALEEIDRIQKTKCGTKFCIIPDSVDEFNVAFRRSLITQSHKRFLIPNSIVYAIQYALYGSNPLKKNQDFTIVDLDGEDPAISIFSLSDDMTIVRKGRKASPKGDNPFAYSSLASHYFSTFSKKHHSLVLEKEDLQTLIAMRILEKFFEDHKKEFVYETKNGEIVAFGYDQNIASEIETKLENTIQFIRAKCDSPVAFITSLRKKEDCIAPTSLDGAFRHILDCYEAGEPIWKEAVPPIELEVEVDEEIQFKRLIPEDTVQNVIIGAQNYTDYPVSGTFWLHAFTFDGKTATRTELPMKRELLGTLNANKKAVFLYPHPLSENLKVSLFVRLDYGNENVFDLIARAEDGSVFKSEWEDRGKTTLSGKIDMKMAKPSLEDFARSKRAYDDICDKLEKMCHSSSENTIKWANGELRNISKKYHYSLVRTLRYSNILENDDVKEYFFERMNGTADCRVGTLFQLAKTAWTCNRTTNEAEQIVFACSDILSKFSCLPVFLGKKENQTEEYDSLRKNFEWLLDSMTSLRRPKEVTQFLLGVSREISSREEDYFHLFDRIKNMAGRRESSDFLEYMARDIGAYSWNNKNWLPTLYSVLEETGVLNRCYDVAISKIEKIDLEDYLKKSMRPSLSILRDLLECMLAFINIRNDNNHFLDPDDSKTNKLLERIRELDKQIPSLKSKFEGGKYFFSPRISSEKSKDSKYSPLVTILQKAIKSTGVIRLVFTEDV